MADGSGGRARWDRARRLRSRCRSAVRREPFSVPTRGAEVLRKLATLYETPPSTVLALLASPRRRCLGAWGARSSGPRITSGGAGVYAIRRNSPVAFWSDLDSCVGRPDCRTLV